MLQKKSPYVSLLNQQLFRFLGVFFLPILLIVAIIYTFNYYCSISLFNWTSELFFQVEYVIVVIGLLIVGGMVGFSLIHGLIALAFLCGYPCLQSVPLEKEPILQSDYNPSKFLKSDYILAMILMLIVEVPFWLYYHSSTYLFSNLLMSYLTTLYCLICWRDNIFRALTNLDQKKNIIRLRPISDKTFKLILVIIVGYLILEIYITWVDTVVYFNSLV